jgi:hypothetical protein
VKIFKKLFGRKKKIEKLEKEIFDLKCELSDKKYIVNNFPPYAINAIPNNQLEAMIERKESKDLVHLINQYMTHIEKHDLCVNFMFVPKIIYEKLLIFLKDYIKNKDHLWSMQIVPIEGLKSSILISNLEVTDEDYIVVNFDKNEE